MAPSAIDITRDTITLFEILYPIVSITFYHKFFIIYIWVFLILIVCNIFFYNVICVNNDVYVDACVYNINII